MVTCFGTVTWLKLVLVLLVALVTKGRLRLSYLSSMQYYLGLWYPQVPGIPGVPWHPLVSLGILGIP